MKEAVIVTSLRTAVGKAPRGALKDTRPDDMAGAVIKAAVERTHGLDPSMIEDVILGCAMPEAEQGMNVARQASWIAGVPKEASAVTINRFCSSGLRSMPRPTVGSTAKAKYITPTSCRRKRPSTPMPS